MIIATFSKYMNLELDSKQNATLLHWEGTYGPPKNGCLSKQLIVTYAYYLLFARELC